jgi:hypothetical protein
MSEEKADRLKTLMGCPVTYNDEAREAVEDAMYLENVVLEYLENKCGAERTDRLASFPFGKIRGHRRTDDETT